VGAPPPLDPSAPGRVEAETPNRRVPRIRSSALSGLFMLACVYTLALARPFLVPLAIGLMLYFLLRPPVRTLKSLRVPEPLGAALVLAALIAFVGVAFYGLSYPAATWAARAPESVRKVESKLRPLAVRIQRVTRTAEEMGRITDATVPASTTPEVKLKEPSLGTLFVGGVQSFLAGTVVVLTMVYFLLAEGDGLLR
jgi:predicted PurR-regulated permease PerM